MSTGSSIRSLAAFALVTLALAWVPSIVHAGTVATFEDPTAGMSPPLPPVLEVNLDADRIYGRWTDLNVGLDLEVAWGGQGSYADAFFTLTDRDDPGIPGIEYTGDATGGTTGAGRMEFYADGAAPGTNDPLVRIDFDAARLTTSHLFASNTFYPNHNVVITVWVAGSPVTLTDSAAFSFGFGTQAPLTPPGAGYKTTATFDSSAVPEPIAVAGLLGLAAPIVVLRTRSRRSR